MSRMALTPTRPARRRSTNASLTMKLSIIHPQHAFGMLTVGLAGRGDPESAVSPLVLGQDSTVEPDRAPLELGGQARLVGRQEDRRAPTPDVLDEVEDFARHLFVEVSRGLVGQQESRRSHDGPREGRPLPLALGELRRVGLGARGEADGRERLEGSRRDSTAGSAGDPEHEGDVLEDGPAGEELGGLENDAERAPEQRHLAAAQRHDVEARDLDLAVRGALVRGEQAEKGGLPGPAGAREDDEIALVDFERDVAEGRQLHWPTIEDLADPMEPNHGPYYSI